MPETVLVDTDILIKISAFDLVAELLALMTSPAGAPAMLGVARFVVARKLARDDRLREPARAIAAFETLLAEIDTVEPDAEELQVAARLEEAASRQGLELDSGESQLVAILLNRGHCLLLTGDKRAGYALAALAPDELRGKLATLEQIIWLMLEREAPALRVRLCAESAMDTALALCAACHREADPGSEALGAALVSYIADQRARTGDLMIALPALRALAA